MRVSFSRNTQNNKVVLRNQIDKIRLLFRKDRESYFVLQNSRLLPRDIKVYQQALLHKSISIRSEKDVPSTTNGWNFGRCYPRRHCRRYCLPPFRRTPRRFLPIPVPKIVQRETLNKLAVEIGLDKLVKYSTRSSSHNSYMYGNAFEAFIGAIYLDQGYDRCKQFMEEKIFKTISTSTRCLAKRSTSSQNSSNGARRTKWRCHSSLSSSFSTKNTIRCSTPKSASKGYRQVPAPVIPRRSRNKMRHRWH